MREGQEGTWPLRHKTPADALSGAGTYAIRNTLTGACYVGASIDIAARMGAPWRLLRAARRHSAALQAAWKADGPGAFECTVLELVAHRAQLPASVHFWRNTLCSLGLYNSSHSGHSARRAPLQGGRVAAERRGRVHVETPAIHVNAVTGMHHLITQEACRVVLQSRPLVSNVLRRVLAEAYLREHPESAVVMRSILEDWEQHS
jgi:hypothetical protein